MIKYSDTQLREFEKEVEPFYHEKGFIKRTAFLVSKGVMKVEGLYESITNLDRYRELDEKLNVVDKEINELEIFELHLKDITSNGKKEILASLGKGVYVKSDMIDSKLLVDVGSNIFVKKTPEQTKEVLSGQIKRLHDMKLILQQTIENMNSEMQKIVKNIEDK